MTTARLILATTCLFYGLFLYWYGGSGTPLGPDRANQLIDEMEERARKRSSGHFDAELFDSFRELMKSDDGGEFYMVNLMRYRKKALYPAGSPYGDSAAEAAARYNAAVIPALFARASHPILLADQVGTFLQPEGAEVWDQVGIVRYRSRLDMLEMASELGESGGGEHKWASIEKTIVFPTTPILDLMFVRTGVGVVMFAIGGGIAYAVRQRA